MKLYKLADLNPITTTPNSNNSITNFSVHDKKILCTNFNHPNDVNTAYQTLLSLETCANQSLRNFGLAVQLIHALIL